MPNSLESMTDLQDVESYLKFGDSKKLQVQKIGTKQGIVVQKDDTLKRIEIRNVKYIPEMYCNLFSLTAAMTQGFSLEGLRKQLMIRKRNYRVNFDRIIKSGRGFLFGIKIIHGASTGNREFGMLRPRKSIS